MTQKFQNQPLVQADGQQRLHVCCLTEKGEQFRLFDDFCLVTLCREELRRSSVKGYDTLKAADASCEGKCMLSSAAGSVVEVSDSYSWASGTICLQRSITVQKAAAGETGFYVDTTLLADAAKDMKEFAWFCPGYWYGKGDLFFKPDERGEAGDTVETFSAPLMLCFDEDSGKALSFTDFSEGMRKTVVEDSILSLPGKLVSEQFYLPGMIIRKGEEGGTAFAYLYPGYSYRNGQGFLYRMLPLQEGLAREAVLEMQQAVYDSYPQAMKQSWRALWQKISPLRHFRDAAQVEQTVLDYVDKSFENKDGVAIYMKDAEFKEASSGFLFRNIDLAWLMLESASQQQLPERQQRAIEVINSQVEGCRMYGDTRGYSIRPSIEALASLYLCCEWAWKHDVPADVWYDTIIRETEPLLAEKEYYSLPLLCRLYGKTGDSKYLDAAMNKGEIFWNENFSKMFFTAGISDCGPNTIDRESAVMAVEGYLDLYETTKDAKWLERAVFCGDYLETMQYIQEIDMDPYGSTGKERYRRFGHTITMAGTGNHMTSLGLSHIAAGEGCGDIYNIYASPDYWRLYHYTGDEHYLDVSRQLLQHTLQYVDMGDRINGASDYLHGTGKGFINEFFGIGVASGYVCGRGQAHGENIGWCPYVLLCGMYRLRKLAGSLEV